MNEESWIYIGTDSQGELEKLVAARLDGRIASGEFTPQNIDYVRDLKRPLLESTASLSSTRLEKLRRLCQLWDIEIRAVKITSHRKFIGPVIVAAKRLFLPIIKVLLKDLVRQQRDFNAAAITLLAELSNEDTPCAHKSPGTIIR